MEHQSYHYTTIFNWGQPYVGGPMFFKNISIRIGKWIHSTFKIIYWWCTNLISLEDKWVSLFDWYLGLNKVIVLPLISTLLELMSGAKHVTKLNLRGHYNLVRICLVCVASYLNFTLAHEWSQTCHKARPLRCLWSCSDSSGWWVESHVLHSVQMLWVYTYTFWTDEYTN